MNPEQQRLDEARDQAFRVDYIPEESSRGCVTAGGSGQCAMALGEFSRSHPLPTSSTNSDLIDEQINKQ